MPARLPLLLSACAPALPQRPEQLSYPPVEFHIPAVDTFELANGVRVYLREDSELPLVQVTAMVGSGALAAPRELTGFDDLFAATLRTGGTLALPAAALEERLDQLAANLSCEHGAVRHPARPVGASQRCSPRGWRFSPICCAVRRLLPTSWNWPGARPRKRLRRNNDEPEAIAERLLMAALYPGHPLGDHPTQASLAAVTREQLQRFPSRALRTEQPVAGGLRRHPQGGVAPPARTTLRRLAAAGRGRRRCPPR